MREDKGGGRASWSNSRFSATCGAATYKKVPDALGCHHTKSDVNLGYAGRPMKFLPDVDGKCYNHG